MKISVLGTEYTLITKKYDEEPLFSEKGICGWCSHAGRALVVCDFRTHPEFKNETDAVYDITRKETVRHELIHAFLYESGLADSSFNQSCGWAKNEEMVDWLAMQMPKIVAAMKEADCL